MQQIPIQPVPVQTLQVVLDNQNCQIAIYQKRSGLFVDVNVDGADVALGVLALETVPLNPSAYMPFVGNLMFLDTEGSEDPVYTGLGSRFQLVYLNGDEYAQFRQ